MVFRRRQPLPTLALATAASLSLACLGFVKEPMLGSALAVFTVAVLRPRQIAFFALLVPLGSAAAVVPWGPERLDVTWLAWVTVAQLAAWALGSAIRRESIHAEALRVHAEFHALTSRRQTVAEERLRIARELHDVVAHSMSVIAVQAGVGHHVIETHPGEAARSLAAIESTSRATLQELRTLVGTLRANDTAHVAPTPSLRTLNDLAEQTRRAGVAVEVTIGGAPRELPPGLDMTAFRIVQEALTNVVKHAGTAEARVAITYGRDDVRIDVTDEGTGPSSASHDAHGLIGMRERVAMFGGDLGVGPRSPHGFGVHARLPFAATEEGAD